MDAELRFISSLLFANRAEQERFFAAQIPKGVFVIHTREIDWLYRFRAQHGVYPSAAAFRQKFSTEKLRKISDPISASLEPVLDLAMFEQMRKVQERTKKELDKGMPLRKVLETYKAQVQSLTTYSSSHVDIDTGKDFSVVHRYRDIVAAFSDQGRGLIDTPWPTVNRYVKYCTGGERITVSARSSLGKSWLVTTWAEYWAQKGIRTGIFTKEMSGEKFADRIECLRYKLPYDLFRSGNLPPRIIRRWRDARTRDKQLRKSAPLFIFGNETVEGINYDTVITKVKEYQLDAAWIDGVYLIRPSELPTNATDTSRFMYLSNKSKELAKYLNIVLGVTVQDNREAEDKKGNTKGTARTVFGSDAWFQDSDVFLQMGGRRGGPRRSLDLTKGRESSLGEITMNFSLDPFPDFSEIGPVSHSASEDGEEESDVVDSVSFTHAK